MMYFVLRPGLAVEIKAKKLAFYILLTGRRFLPVCLNFFIWTCTRTA